MAVETVEILTAEHKFALRCCFRLMNAYASGELMGHSQTFSSDPKLVLADVYATLAQAFGENIKETEADEPLVEPGAPEA